MFKKVICLLMVLCITISFPVCAEGFSDVSKESPYYDAIMNLSKKGIINGYDDSTFRPEGKITRAEAAAVITRAAEIPKSSAESVYYDVENDFWGCGYIMAATENKIINGMGNGMFAPDDKVTYYEIIKMLVCMAGMEYDAAQKGGWPKGYVEVARNTNIIDLTAYYDIMYGDGSKAANRGDVARFVYNTISYLEKNIIYINNQKLFLGMSTESLDSPDETLESTGNFKWNVYGTDTYKNFYAIGVDADRIVAIASTGKAFSYLDYKCGDIIGDETIYGIYADSNDNNKIHSIKLFNDNYNPVRYDITSFSDEQLLDEGKMNFHFTNAFRVMHNLKPFKWSEKAAKSAKLHSEDMAENDYFSHTNRNGLSSSQRMSAQGINLRKSGENISGGGGKFLGFHSFYGLVNSSGHRENMLSDYDYLGVGIACNPNSTYTYYHTQNFFSEG